MYPVSELYKIAMKRPVRKQRLIGTVNGHAFTDANILSGSFSINNQCSDETQVLIGQVYVAELKVTLTGLDAERYSLKDKQIMPTFGLMVSPGTYENVPLGVFNITEANWGTSGIAITAYDNMKLLDRSFSGRKLIGTPYVLAQLACESCGLELAMTKADFSEFANGEVALQLYADNDINTWRDVISWIAQTCGCNVFADRSGRIVFLQYSRKVTDTLSNYDRFADSTFGDYETRYTGISRVDVESEGTKYIGEDQDDGLTYNLGTNPFLQNAADTLSLDEMQRNILDSLKQILYVPFKVTSACDPAYDLMDVFRFTGGIADETKISCMTKFNFQYNDKYTMQGVGSNPALATGNSKSDKNLSGLMERVESIESSTNRLLFDYNTGPIIVGQTEQAMGMITFYISEQADVEGHFLMSYKANGSTHAIIRFYDTTVEELYSPVEMDIQDGIGMIGIPHSYLHREQGIHAVYVTAQCTVGTIEADTRDVYFTIDAGNFAESVDEIGMDIRDITMRQLLESNGPDQIWVAGIEDGKLLISRRNYSENQKSRPTWEGVYTPGKAVAAAIEFDGDWVLRTGAEKFTIETEDQPWIFWIETAEEGVLYAQRGTDESTRFIVDSDVSTVHACKGYSSQMYLSQDQGLILTYTKKDGRALYRQYTYNTEQRAKVWSTPTALLPEEKWSDINVHRLNDYRIGFELTNDDHNVWLLSDRTYVAQSVYPENAKFQDENMLGLSFFRKEDTIDFSSHETLFDDPKAPQKEFHIHYPYPIKSRTSYLTGLVAVSINDGESLSSEKYGVKLVDGDIVVTLKEEAAATRSTEAVVKIKVRGGNGDFYLSNGGNITHLIMEDQEYSWTIERDITVVHVFYEEDVVFLGSAGGGFFTTATANQTQPYLDSSDIRVSPEATIITKTTENRYQMLEDETHFFAAVDTDIKTYMTGDAPI